MLKIVCYFIRSVAWSGFRYFFTVLEYEFLLEISNPMYRERRHWLVRISLRLP